MKHHSSSICFTAALFAALATPSIVHAAITASNMDAFDSGFTHWNTAGDAAIVTAGGNSLAMLTNSYPAMPDDAPLADGALNLSGNSPLMAGGDLEAFVGVTVGALDRDFLDQATEGSAMTTTIQVAAGDVLQFNWNLVTRDTAGLDYGFLTVNGNLMVLAQATDAGSVSTGGYLTETGFNQGEYVFTQGGTMTVSFGVADVGDYSSTTGLMVDNVALISAVPEPGTTLLLGSTVLLVAFGRRRSA